MDVISFSEFISKVDSWITKDHEHKGPYRAMRLGLINRTGHGLLYITGNELFGLSLPGLDEVSPYAVAGINLVYKIPVDMAMGKLVDVVVDKGSEVIQDSTKPLAREMADKVAQLYEFKNMREMEDWVEYANWRGIGSSDKVFKGVNTQV